MADQEAQDVEQDLSLTLSNDEAGRTVTGSAALETEKESIFSLYLKSIIYGGLDGIITTFAVVAGVQGASLSVEVIIALGMGNLLADAISMGVGDYLSEKAEIDLAINEQTKWQNKLSDERSKKDLMKKLIESYKDNYPKMNEKDIKNLVKILIKDEDLFVSNYMIECGDIDPPDLDTSPLMSGAITMASFMIFGFVPLIVYIVYQIFGNGDNSAQTVEFIIAIILSLITMSVLGALKGKITNEDKVKAAAFVAANGAAAGLASYLVTWGVAELVGIRGGH